MNLLVYFRFLRPLRSLVVVAIYTVIAWGWGEHLLRLDPATAKFIALAVALPLLLGFFIAGAAHEPMHRPFAAVLPNLRRRQRTVAAVSVFVAAIAATCGATWIAPTVPPVATFGLAVALAAALCLDRHQRLGGQAGGLAAFLVWLVIVWAVGPKLAVAMSVAPWLFLLGGLAVGAASLVRGFSRESARARAGTLFVAMQTNIFAHFLHRGMVARWQAEVLAQHARKKSGRSSTGRDWTVRSVGATTRDWMRVFWHASFGGRLRGSFLDTHLKFAAAVLVNAFALPGLARIFGQTEYWAPLARLAAPEAVRVAENVGAGIEVFAMYLHPSMAALIALLLLRPQLAYPISRTRLARVACGQAAVQWIAALVVPAATIFPASLVGQLVSGRTLPGYGLPALLAVDLALAALLPLLVATSTDRRPTLRILAAVPIFGALMLVAFTRPYWGTWILSPLGVASALAAIAGGQWLVWQRFHRQYATEDLTLEPGFMDPRALSTRRPH
ncbi:MAG: hypothetical protein HY302_10960 [Opitutae bacterium]|nr:hypothetical protein [Opitutae bacterium]